MVSGFNVRLFIVNTDSYIITCVASFYCGHCSRQSGCTKSLMTLLGSHARFSNNLLTPAD